MIGVQHHETLCHGLKNPTRVYRIFILALSFYDIKNSLAKVTTLCYDKKYSYNENMCHQKRKLSIFLE